MYLEDIPFGLLLVWHSALHRTLSQVNSDNEKHVDSNSEASEEVPERSVAKVKRQYKYVHHQAKDF